MLGEEGEAKVLRDFRVRKWFRKETAVSLRGVWGVTTKSLELDLLREFNSVSEYSRARSTAAVRASERAGDRFVRCFGWKSLQRAGWYVTGDLVWRPRLCASF